MIRLVSVSRMSFCYDAWRVGSEPLSGIRSDIRGGEISEVCVAMSVFSRL